VGGRISLYFTDWLAIGSGISYEEKGYQISYPQNSPERETISEDFDFSYLGVPLTLDFLVIDKQPHLMSITSGFEILRKKSQKIIRGYSDGTSRDVSDSFYFPEYISNFWIGASYSYFITENLFLSAGIKTRANIEYLVHFIYENTDYSFVAEFTLGYKFSVEGI
jgi:hypothetical protein